VHEARAPSAGQSHRRRSRRPLRRCRPRRDGLRNAARHAG
jgi:hypothetical protein